MALLVVLDLDAHADALEAGVVEVDRGCGGSLVTVLFDEGPELDGDVVLVVADPDVGVLADEVVVDGTGEVGVDVGEGMSAAMRIALFSERSSSSLRVLWPAWMAVMVTSPTLSTLDLMRTPEGAALSPSAVVAGDGNVAGLASELDASLGELRRGKHREEGVGPVSWVSSKRRKVGAFRGLVPLEANG